MRKDVDLSFKLYNTTLCNLNLRKDVDLSYKLYNTTLYNLNLRKDVDLSFKLYNFIQSQFEEGCRSKFSNRPGFPVPGIPVPGLAILSYPGPGPGPGQMLIYDPGPG